MLKFTDSDLEEISKLLKIELDNGKSYMDGDNAYVHFKSYLIEICCYTNNGHSCRVFLYDDNFDIHENISNTDSSEKDSDGYRIYKEGIEFEDFDFTWSYNISAKHKKYNPNDFDYAGPMI